MMHYIRRQQAKKLASGATQQELDDLLRFPEPIPPAPAQNPEGEEFSVCIILYHVAFSCSQE